MRKLASVQIIDALNPIENADSIEVADILGWKVVVKKGEFQIGSKCIYLEIDSIVPQIPYFEFMKDRRYRVRTIKLRGQISQGLAIPLYHLNTTFLDLPEHFTPPHCDYEIGFDLTEILGIVKYEPELHSMIGGDTLGSFPNWISKTDEDRIQSNPVVLQKLVELELDATEKLDGCSATYFLMDDHFGVCSRNWELKDTESNVYWQMARKYQIEEKLRAMGNGYYLQGEIIGPNIQENRLKLAERQFRVFNFGLNGLKFGFSVLVDFCEKFDLLCVPMVPLPPFSTVEDLLSIANAPSQLNSTVAREGIVIRSTDGTISFKVINNEYLLRHKI